MTYGRWFRRVGSLVLLGLALAFLWRSFLQLGGLVTFRDAVPGWGAVLLAALLSLGWLVSMAAGWVWVLRNNTTAESLPTLVRLCAAFMRSFISRYVPGKIWPAVVLWERLHDQIGPSPVLRSYLLQQLHLLASAAVLSIGALPLVLAQTSGPLPWTGISIGLACGFGLIWALVPRPFFTFAHRWAPQKWREHLTFHGSVGPWATGFGIFVLSGVFQGAALIPIWQAVAESGEELGFGSMAGVICAYAAARVIGQGVAIVPAGIGVRESVFVLLVSALSKEAALISVLWLRLIAMVVEFVAWTASAMFDGRNKPR